MTDEPGMMAAAIEYARRGVKIFPLKPREKAPLTEHGFKDATADEAEIRAWWTRWPDANIGAPTGANGWTVLDIDSDSPTEIFEIALRLGIENEAPISRTGKGRQVFYRAAAGIGPAVRVAGLKVDTRSGESYVVLPPSVHPNGRAYRWNVPLSDPLPEMSAETLRVLTSGGARGKPLAGKTGGNVPRGMQHDALVRIAGWHRNEGSDAAQIAAILRAASHTWTPRPPDEDCRRIAESIARYEPGAAAARDAVRENETVWDRGDRDFVAHNPTGIEWIRTTADGGEQRWMVIDGHLEVTARVDVEGDTFFEVTGSKRMVVQADALLKTLQREARVLDRAHAADALSLVLRRTTEDRVRSVHPAIGVYADEAGRFDLCTEPFPLYKEQEDASRQLAEAVRTTATRDEVQAYVDIAGKVHTYESYPAMGSSAVAPFARELRRRHVLVCHVLHYSHVQGIGKSKLAEAFSEKLYGRHSVGADAISSDYRFAAHMDAAGTSLTVNEGDRLDPKKLGPVLKDSAESEVVDKRGTPDLGMVTYRARTILTVTANALVFSQRTHLTRFLAARYDERMARERHRRENRRAFDALYRKLRPIGFDLARHAITLYPTADVLLSEVERVRTEIENAYPGDFDDPRRPQAWALVYVGLGVWESYAAAKGASFKRPPIAAFVEHVVLQVEASTFEAGVSVLSRLMRWWDAERAFNRDPKTDVPRGRDEIWTDGEIRLDGGKDASVVRGTMFTAALLDRYNKAAEPDLRIPTLAELGRQVAVALAVDLPLVAGDGKGLVRRLGGKNTRVVFVPGEEPEDHGVPADGERRASQIEDATTLRDIVGELDDGTGSDHGDIMRVAQERGFAPATVDRWLKHWLETGEVYQPVKGRFRLTEKMGGMA